MSRWPILTAVLLCVCASAQAAPPAGAANDEMGQFLASHGLISQIGGQLDQVRRTVSDKASELVVNAMGFLGVPYKRGGDSLADGGFDCSGFVRAMYEQTLGLMLPRQAAQQAAATEKIPRQDLRPGDLVFFNTMRRAFSHVGIYIGDGKFIHSPRTGADVRIEDMDARYWSKRFDGARRVETGDVTATAAQTPTVTAAAPAAAAAQATPNDVALQFAPR
ncbi:MAG: putative lipoprotein [Burkholderiaceae bacterium]|jgi:cell wall-associated NlpC family hydrolase|nr:MAG: putative lipoprotein [Burkholderiaceae bacterium]